MHLLSIGYSFGQGHGLVVELLVLVHPHLCGPPRVLGEDLSCATGERVWVLVPEDVTHPRAGDDLKPATALPHSERNLCKSKLSLETC